MLPSHKTQPEGIALVAPDHKTIAPLGIPDIPVRLAPLTAGKVAGKRASGIVPDVRLLALKFVKSG